MKYCVLFLLTMCLTHMFGCDEPLMRPMEPIVKEMTKEETPETMAEMKAGEVEEPEVTEIPEEAKKPEPPMVTAINHYHDWQRTKLFEGMIRPGKTVYTGIIFSKNVSYTVANDHSALPDIRYVLDGVETRYTIVPHGSGGDNFQSGDCKPIKGTHAFLCKYTLPEDASGVFSVNHEGIPFDDVSLVVDLTERFVAKAQTIMDNLEQRNSEFILKALADELGFPIMQEELDKIFLEETGLTTEFVSETLLWSIYLEEKPEDEVLARTGWVNRELVEEYLFLSFINPEKTEKELLDLFRKSVQEKDISIDPEVVRNR